MTERQTNPQSVDLDLSSQWMFHHAPTALLLLKPDGSILQINSAARSLLGISEISSEETSFKHFLSPENHPILIQGLNQVFREGQPFHTDLICLRGLNQVPFDAHLSLGAPIPGLPSVILSIFERTSPLRQTETSTDIDLDSRTNISTTTDAIITFNEHGIIEMANPAAERGFGYLSHELIGVNINQLLRAGDYPAPEQKDNQFNFWSSQGNSPRCKGIRKSGQAFPVQSAIYESKHANRRLYTVLIKADAFLGQEEDRTRKAQQMELIGQLAGGIAHDFNNLLTIINGYSQLLIDKGTLQSNETQLLQFVRNAGERAAVLTHQLLAFSQKQFLSFSRVDLNRIVTTIRAEMQKNYSEELLLHFTLEPNLWTIRGDAVQIERVLLALIANAQDAMPHGGVLTITTRNAEVTPKRGTLELPSGFYAVLSVCDTGTGMTPEVLHRIFEPFFTTKPPGKGTGLGLSMVHGTVAQLGGYIHVDSQPEKGSCFHLYFSRLDEKPGLSNVAKDDHFNKRFVILVAEDDPRVRKLLELSLTSRGYTVLVAANGHEALSLASEYVGPIHVLVTDVNMPLLSGYELIEKLQATRPKIQSICISGYPDAGAPNSDVLDQSKSTFMAKPFTPSALVTKVEELLKKT